MLWAVDEPVLRAFGVNTPFWDADAQGLKISRRQSPRDERMAQRHAILFPGDRGFSLSSVGAVHDTYVDGDQLEGSSSVQHGSIVRTGATVWIVLRDVSRFESASVDPRHGPQLAGAGAARREGASSCPSTSTRSGRFALQCRSRNASSS